ncbi:MAG: sigma factor-like helix-turn-helix DNA-binding protein [Kofleriaceae bacterium]
MSVDDRESFEEAVTTESRAYWAEPAADQEVPAFMAMGTDPGIREEDLEVTQPIPRQTMAEMVFAPEQVTPRVRAQGTVAPGRSRAARDTIVDDARATTSIALADLREDSTIDDGFAKGTQAMPAIRSEMKLSPSYGSLAELAEVSARGEAQDPEFDQVDMPLSVPGTSRKVRPRRTRPRARTIAARRLTNVELRQVEDSLVEQADRPRTRAECSNEQRPCPWVSCKHHLYLDVNPRTGSIKLNFPDLEPWELQHTCALDVADDGGHTLEEVGDITNLTRERIRQLEMRGLIELKSRSRGLR